MPMSSIAKRVEFIGFFALAFLIAGAEPVAAQALKASASQDRAAAAPSPDGRKLSGELKIGAWISLTGSGAFNGTRGKKGMELAVEDIANRRFLDDVKINFIVDDDAGIAQQAVNIVNKQAYQDKVVAAICCSLTNYSLVALPTAVKSGIPTIIFNSTGPDMARIGKNIFRISEPYTEFIEQLVQQIIPAKGIKTAAIIFGSDNESLVSIANDYRSFLAKQGVKVVVNEAVLKTDTDFTAQLTKVRAAAPDVLLPVLPGPLAAPLILAARQMGIKSLMLGHQGHNTPDLFKIGGKAVIGEILPANWHLGVQTTSNRRFVEMYRAKYKEDPDQNAANGFQAMWFLALGVKKAGTVTDRQKILDGLASIREFEGVLGPDGKLRMDEGRELRQKGLILNVDEKGAFSLWKKP